ncbi:MAG: hypothetical protein M3498_16590 [Deinococcota bacterium]|nr:hypothetical protein [Deinococcota bacterium]
MLQLEESFFDENEAVAYRCDRLQFTVFRTDQALPSPGGWAKQPGWHGGTVPAISWSVELEPKAFKEAWMKMKDEGVASFYDSPKWLGYWSYPVYDPMGHTVELSCPTDDPEIGASERL